MRISVHEVDEAYKLSGLQPTHDNWVENFDGECYACPLATVAMARGKTSFMEIDKHMDNGTALYFLAQTLQLSERYVDGFIHAIDNGTIGWDLNLDPRHNPCTEWTNGYHDGLAVAEYIAYSYPTCDSFYPYED